MWITLFTQVNAKPEYIDRVGFPYMNSGVIYKGSSYDKAQLAAYESAQQIVDNGGNLLYQWDDRFMDRGINYALIDTNGLYWQIQIRKY